jgi:O-antigen/teichoic acid export membrane protein
MISIILGMEYLPSVNILRICIFADIAHGVFFVMLTTLDGIRKTTTNLIITIIQASATLVMLFLLVPCYGILGAAYTDVVVSVIGIVLGFFFVKKITRLRITQNMGYVKELIRLLRGV